LQASPPVYAGGLSLGIPADDQAPFEREKSAFRRKRQFLRQHIGEFVAMHDGEVVAADKSRSGVLRKFFARYPAGTSVYIGFIGRTPVARVTAPFFVRRHWHIVAPVSGAYSTPFSDGVPGPHVKVRITSGDGSGIFRELPGRLDTGADITLVPLPAINALGLQVITDDLELHDGTGRVTSDVRMYRADVTIEGLPVQTVGVAATEAAIIYVGIDVLNDYAATFDGPEQRFNLA
jgi:uncharacterized protein DUF5678